MKRITIKDLARQAGVNPSTVSRALKQHPDISPELRERICQLARDLHYRPNSMAVSLRQRRSRLVGIVIPETTMFFYPSLIKGVEYVLHCHGLSPMMLPSDDCLQRESENAQICFDNDVAGLLIAFSSQTMDTEHLALLQEAGAPIVMFDKVLENTDLDAVELDDFADAALAVRYLLEKGCRRIAGIFGNLRMRITQQRLKGFSEALKHGGTALNPDHIFFAANPAEAFDCARLAMASPQPPDGIFAMSDEVLTGALAGILDAGRKVPEECALICMSDGLLPYYLRPRIPFIRHDGYEVGRLAAERLCAMIQSGEHRKINYRGQRAVLKSQLVLMDGPQNE